MPAPADSRSAADSPAAERTTGRPTAMKSISFEGTNWRNVGWAESVTSKRVAAGEHRRDRLERDLVVEADVRRDLVREPASTRSVLDRPLADEGELGVAVEQGLPHPRTTAAPARCRACRRTSTRNLSSATPSRCARRPAKNCSSVPFGISMRCRRLGRGSRRCARRTAASPRRLPQPRGRARCSRRALRCPRRAPGEIWLKLSRLAGHRSRTSSTNGARIIRAIAAPARPVKSGGVVARTTSGATRAAVRPRAAMRHERACRRRAGSICVFSAFVRHPDPQDAVRIRTVVLDESAAVLVAGRRRADDSGTRR